MNYLEWRSSVPPQSIDWMTDGHPADHYIVSSLAQTGVQASSADDFSTAAGIFRDIKGPLYASKSKQLIGLETFGCVTNLELLFSFDLR